MANTYTLISSNTVGAGGASSVTFSSIPQTYTDLLVKVSTRNTNSSGSKVILNPNAVTSGFSGKTLLGDGATASSGATTTNGYQAGLVISTYTANVFGNAEFYIPNYALASTVKSVSVDSVTENNAATAETQLNGGKSGSMAAFTSITLQPDANNFAQYSTFYLYGIKNS